MVRSSLVRAVAVGALALVGGLSVSAPTSAQFTPAFSGKAGIEGYYQKYREGSVDVTLDGWLGAIAVEGQVDYQSWMLRADARYSYGEVDYSGSGTSSGEPNEVFEGRVTIGRSILLGFQDRSRITPYLGYGYRRLYNQAASTVTSTGALGYDRLSQYHYVPVGVEALFFLGDNLSLRPAVEYDYFIHGTQDSYLSQTGLFDDVHNEQDSGYGLRASVMFGTRLGSLRTEFGPFFRYWNIEQSDTAALTIGGVVVGTAWEPANETWEAGLALRFLF
jgi:hypothetical protein